MERHRVRKRPARYPPIADAIASVRISHMIAAAPMPAAETPAFDHGEIADNPNPAPSASRISERAAATNAPPITAPQDTPEAYTSPDRSKTGKSAFSIVAACILRLLVLYSTVRGRLATLGFSV